MKEGREETVGACLRFDRELEAYLEGESRPFVTTHAQDCTSCRVLLSDLELIRLAARDGQVEQRVRRRNHRHRLHREMHLHAIPRL